MTEETADRIAAALEAIACTLAAAVVNEPATGGEQAEQVYQTQQGPKVIREGRLVPLDEE
jgi:hypothetical protein